MTREERVHGELVDHINHMAVREELTPQEFIHIQYLTGKSLLTAFAESVDAGAEEGPMVFQAFIQQLHSLVDELVAEFELRQHMSQMRPMGEPE